MAQAEKNAQIEDKKTQLLLKKKIWALKCNMSKLEASKTKVEERLKQVEMELETEKILRRKKKVKDKNKTSKVNEMTTKMTRSIEWLQNKIKVLEKEKRELEDKNTPVSNTKRVKSRLNQVLEKKLRRNSSPEASKKWFVSNKDIPKLCHSQSNDALVYNKKKTMIIKSSQKELRDLSANSKKSGVPNLNLSEITHCSPFSTHRIFSNRSYKKEAGNPTNTTTTNLSFWNSLNGVFKNSVIGAQGDGSSKYCAAWKFKEWKKKQLNYDVEELIKNRDMLRTVQCLGWNMQFEVKYFLDHVKSCRLAYNIPSMVPKDDIFAKMSYNNHKYFTQKKIDKSPCSSKHKEKAKIPTTKESQEIDMKDLREWSFLSGSHILPDSLFKKLRMMNTPQGKVSDLVDKLKLQKLRMSTNDTLLKDNSDFLSASVKCDRSVMKPKLIRHNTTKNDRYSTQIQDDDSDEPDVPNENPRNLSSMELANDQEDNDSSSLLQYQTVPRSMTSIKCSETTLMNLSENMQDTHTDYATEMPSIQDPVRFSSPIGKCFSPLGKIRQALNPEDENTDFKLDVMSEF